MTQQEKKQKYQWKWYCQTCDQYFRTSKDLTAHKKVHPQKCKYCGKVFKTIKELGGHYVSICEKQPNREQILQRRKNNNKHVPHKHTQQAKQKIRQAHKKFLQQHPQKHPWKRKDKFISKPCQELKHYFLENNIHFYPEYQNPAQFQGHYYSIDIAFPNQKIAIQINGNQHYNKDGTLKSDYQKRHNIIEKAGWKIIELPFNKSYKLEVRQSLLKLIKQNVDFNYDYTKEIQQKLKLKQLFICPNCGGKKNRNSKVCKKCYRNNSKKYRKNTNLKPKRKLQNIICLNCGKQFHPTSRTKHFCSHQCERIYRRKNIPSKQQLINDVQQLHSMTAIGKKYSKTYSAVKRWFKQYGLRCDRKAIRNNEVYQYQGQKYLLSELAKKFNINKLCLVSRLSRGYTIEKAIEMGNKHCKSNK